MSQNLDKPSMGDLEDLWVPYEKWGIHFANGTWENDDLMDEETPLLGHRAINRNLGWLWRKLLSWM